MIQRRPLDELHQHHELVFNPKRGVQRGNIGVIQTRLHLDFAHEPVREIGIPLQIWEQDLHRLNAIRNRVADFVDAPHASGAENLQNFVITDARTNFVVHGFPA
ncbi:MAG: hypothetical protein H6Q07_3459 [Acidobacteria bacterium]|nr:hypothetical protein [Acidobacteriota bacterium]